MIRALRAWWLRRRIADEEAAVLGLEILGLHLAGVGDTELTWACFRETSKARARLAALRAKLCEVEPFRRKETT